MQNSIVAGLLEGKVALITGASSGIGQTTALCMARGGARLILGSRRVHETEATVRQIKEEGGEAVFIRTDVRDSRDVETLVNTAIETYGRLDCAFNNAGIEGAIAYTADCTEANWDEVLSTNLTGTWLCMKYEIREMLRSGKGSIVNNASILGLRATIGAPAYMASKGGIIQLTQAAAVEYGASGIRVNVVCPSGIRTPMLERILGGPWPEEKAKRLVALGGRFGTPVEVAEMVIWLCSDAASFVTGQPFVVDGGASAGYLPVQQNLTAVSHAHSDA